MPADVIINVVDATSPERSLYLTLRLKSLGIPVVTALNMTDVLEKRGGKIDTAKLSSALGIPVVNICARRGQGVKELMETAAYEAAKATAQSNAAGTAAYEAAATIAGKTKAAGRAAVHTYSSFDTASRGSFAQGTALRGAYAYTNAGANSGDGCADDAAGFRRGEKHLPKVHLPRKRAAALHRPCRQSALPSADGISFPHSHYGGGSFYYVRRGGITCGALLTGFSPLLSAVRNRRRAASPHGLGSFSAPPCFPPWERSSPFFRSCSFSTSASPCLTTAVIFRARLSSRMRQCRSFRFRARRSSHCSSATAVPFRQYWHRQTVEGSSAQKRLALAIPFIPCSARLPSRHAVGDVFPESSGGSLRRAVRCRYVGFAADAPPLRRPSPQSFLQSRVAVPPCFGKCEFRLAGQDYRSAACNFGMCRNCQK